MVAGESPLPRCRSPRTWGVSSDGRVKRLVSSGRERIDTARAAVEARRPRVRGMDATLSAYERDRDRAGFLLAGALAYRLFLWLLPFMLVIVGGLGFLEASDHDNPSNLADKLGVVGLASKSVSEAAADAEHARFLALLIGIPALYVASLAAIKAFRTVERACAGASPPDRSDASRWQSWALLGLIAAFLTVTFIGTAIRHESPGARCDRHLPDRHRVRMVRVPGALDSSRGLPCIGPPCSPVRSPSALGLQAHPSRQRVFHLVPHLEVL